MVILGLVPAKTVRFALEFAALYDNLQKHYIFETILYTMQFFPISRQKLISVQNFKSLSQDVLHIRASENREEFAKTFTSLSLTTTRRAIFLV